MGVHGFDSGRMVYIHADKVRMSLNTYKTINGKTKENRIAEGAKIINMAFSKVAVAA